MATKTLKLKSLWSSAWASKVFSHGFLLGWTEREQERDMNTISVDYKRKANRRIRMVAQD